MHNFYLAIGGAALAAWIFGAIYYGLLGKTWQRAQGLDPEACKGQKMPLTPMVVSLGSELVMAFIFLHLLAGLQVRRWQAGLIIGLAIGVAFMTTTTLVNNMFQRRSLTLTVIDSLHWIGVAAIQGAVLVVLG